MIIILVSAAILIIICMLFGCGQEGSAPIGIYKASQNVYNNVTQSDIPNHPTSTPIYFNTVNVPLKDPLFSISGYKFCLSANERPTYWKVYVHLSISDYDKGPDTFNLATSTVDTTTILKTLRLTAEKRSGLIERVIKVDENTQMCIFVFCRPIEEVTRVTGTFEIVQI
jgi:hypothetical protein